MEEFRVFYSGLFSSLYRMMTRTIFSIGDYRISIFNVVIWSCLAAIVITFIGAFSKR